MSELIQREIDRDELADIATDVGALVDYVLMLNGGVESELFLRVERTCARLMIELGWEHRDDDGEVGLVDESDTTRWEAASSRARGWVREDLSRQLDRVKRREE